MKPELGCPIAKLNNAGKKLRDIRIELSYIPAPFKEETFNFPVSIISK